MPDISLDTQIQILVDGLAKKETALREIVNITDNQRTVIESGLPPNEIRAFLLEMNQEKQAFILQVKGCDNLFESILKEVGPELDARQDLYKPQVAQMQQLIRRIMDLDVKVRVQEEENNQKLAEVSPPPAHSGLKPKPAPLPPDSVKVIQAYEREQQFRH